MVRDIRLDSLKGGLIILVILGHLIGECGTGHVNECARKIIYSFHMPLFVLISGYFSRIYNNSNDFYKCLLYIFVPLVIFQFLNGILLYIYGYGLDYSMIYIPYWTLWYLLSLICWRIILQYIPHFFYKSNNSFFFFAITVLFSVLCGLMYYGRILSIQRTINFFPFFLLGYYIKRGIFKPQNYNNIISVCIICLVFYLIIAGFVPDNCDLLQKGADQYDVSQLFAKLVILLYSLLLSLSFFNIAIESKLLAYLGKDSLFIYLFHGIIIKFLIHPIITYFSLPTSFIYVMLYCGIIILIIWMLGKVKYFRMLSNPFKKY